MTRVGEGMLLVDKPAGPTSHDVVARIRRLSGMARVGHTGTLDPPATGLLVLLLERATRLAPYVHREPKAYVGSILLGVSTLTDDLTGEVLTRHTAPLPSAEQVRAAALRLRGRGWQIPPAVSARHVGGRRLYRAARRGIVLEAPAASIEVDRFDILPTSDPAMWEFETSVSSGTFVRGLARDLGAALGCGAVVAALRRTGIGPLHVRDALGERDLGDAGALARALVPLDEVPLVAPSVTLPAASAAYFRQGRALPLEAGAADGIVAARDERGALLGMGLAASGLLKPRMVLAPPERVDAPDDAVIPSGRSSS